MIFKIKKKKKDHRYNFNLDDKKKERQGKAHFKGEIMDSVLRIKQATDS